VTVAGTFDLESASRGVLSRNSETGRGRCVSDSASALLWRIAWTISPFDYFLEGAF